MNDEEMEELKQLREVVGGVRHFLSQFPSTFSGNPKTIPALWHTAQMHVISPLWAIIDKVEAHYSVSQDVSILEELVRDMRNSYSSGDMWYLQSLDDPNRFISVDVWIEQWADKLSRGEL